MKRGGGRECRVDVVVVVVRLVCIFFSFKQRVNKWLFVVVVVVVVVVQRPSLLRRKTIKCYR
jgi:hypothetical protein